MYLQGHQVKLVFGDKEKEIEDHDRWVTSQTVRLAIWKLRHKIPNVALQDLLCRDGINYIVKAHNVQAMLKVLGEQLHLCCPVSVTPLEVPISTMNASTVPVVDLTSGDAPSNDLPTEVDLTNQSDSSTETVVCADIPTNTIQPSTNVPSRPQHEHNH